jgi:uncharacterized protein YyaL (SSP411 family)
MTGRASSSGTRLFNAGRWALVCAALALCAARATSMAQEKPPALRQVAPAAEAADGVTRRAANRLAKETSPYLLLHAHNPVDWYAWGDEALSKAKADNKLIFLSIGYSSCYWCHVMERESFMDEEVAEVLNEHFVCIKVDREERPDIDHVYMTALSAMGRRGGWPLTMILTPDARPIIGGTYFPPRDKELELPGGNASQGAKQQVTGLLTLVKLVVNSWKKNPQEIRAYADQVAAAVKRGLRQRIAPQAPVAADTTAKTIAALAEEFDSEYGGFGFSDANPRRPKFPEPSNLAFLLNCAEGKDQQARRMLTVTLERMARGGIRDHLGGGFHRYSTDRYWRVPHFEKMLYDNAQLAGIYSSAYRLTGQAEFRHVAEEILAFVARELTSPEGAFYSALDAETDGDEGQFYVWTRDQIGTTLAPDEARLVGLVYGTSGEPNFEARYVLEISRPLSEIAAAEKDLSVDALAARLEPIREKLLAARDKRKRPLTDSKILTAWNGLMIRGLADAGRLLEDERHVQAAARAADFILANLRAPSGRLQRSFAGAKAHLNAYLDDYAFLVDGLLALHEATGDARWLAAADDLTRTQIELFWDDEQGGFYFTSGDHEELLARSKDPVDSALPSGNAIAADNLVYLAQALKRPDDLGRAEKTIACFSALVNESPAAVPRMVLAWSALEAARKALPVDERDTRPEAEPR